MADLRFWQSALIRPYVGIFNAFGVGFSGFSQ